MKTTEELMHSLEFPDLDIERFLEEQSGDFLSVSPSALWKEYILQSQLKKSQIIANSEFEPVYFYEILSGRKNPSRDKVLRLLLGMGASLSQCQLMLKAYGLPLLYPRRKRDCLLIYCINQRLSPAEAERLLIRKEEPGLK